MTDPEDQEAYQMDAQLLSDLWIFRSAARDESITRAATRLRVTQGAVSQRVLRLEARLGAPLFRRDKGRLTLTDIGVALLDAMNDATFILNTALSRLDRLHRGAIVIGCVPSLATEWLIPRLDDFYRDHPGIELFIRSDLGPTSVERMEDEGIDVLIQYQDQSILDLHELASFQELILPVCSPQYRQNMDAGLLDQTGIVRLHDDVPWLAATADFEWRTWNAARLDTNQVSSNKHFNLAHLAYHAASRGQGIAIGRAILINRRLASGALVAATDLVPVASARYRILAVRPGDARSPITHFAEWLMQTFAETQADTLQRISGKLEPRLMART